MMEIDKAKVCFSEKPDLSREHFIELIGRSAEDCAAWERKLRSQGHLKDAEKMQKTREKMLKSLKRLNDIKPGSH